MLKENWDSIDVLVKSKGIGCLEKCNGLLCEWLSQVPQTSKYPQHAVIYFPSDLLSSHEHLQSGLRRRHDGANHGAAVATTEPGRRGTQRGLKFINTLLGCSAGRTKTGDKPKRGKIKAASKSPKTEFLESLRPL